MNLKKSFLLFCEKNKFEINQNQLDIIISLNNYYLSNFNQNFLKKIYKNKTTKRSIYLEGEVDIGKTMILHFL